MIAGVMLTGMHDFVLYDIFCAEGSFDIILIREKWRKNEFALQ